MSLELPVISGCYSGGFQRGIEPDPLEALSEWADANMELPTGLSSEPGPWRTQRTPYLREILDHLSPSWSTEEVIVMKGTQLGLTTAAVIWAGHIIHRAPGPILLVEPTVDVAKKLSKQRIQLMLERVKVLRGLVKESRARDSGNTILMKEFEGGTMVITGANSGVGLRFMAARYLVLDEEDAYPQDVDGEGHPSELAKNRLSTFARAKVFRISTPLEKLTSVIEPAYQAGSRAHYHVPCPICLHPQALRWANIIFTFDGQQNPDRTAYRCEKCGHLIPESQKTWMLENGRWVHEDPTNAIKSYHLPCLYAPYGWKRVSWSALVREFLRAKRKADGGDRRALKVFITTRLAETWEEDAEKLEAATLADRREEYAAPVPNGVLILTCAVDVQDTFLQAEVLGWGVGEESWSICYKIFYGSPAQKTVWGELDLFLQQSWQSEAALSMRVACTCVDTGGHYAKEAYEFVRPRQVRRVFAIKGSNQPAHPLVGRPSRNNLGRVHLFPLGTDSAKDTIFSRLKLSEFGPGYCHFPRLPQYDDEYFAQLTAEEKRSKYERGILIGYVYKKLRARNEVLDLRVYNMAALAILNVNLDQLAQQWESMVQKKGQSLMAARARPARRIISRGIDADSLR